MRKKNRIKYVRNMEKDFDEEIVWRGLVMTPLPGRKKGAVVMLVGWYTIIVKILLGWYIIIAKILQIIVYSLGQDAIQIILLHCGKTVLLTQRKSCTDDCQKTLVKNSVKLYKHQSKH